VEHYVTYFDSLFIPQGLTLHQSLEKHAGEYLLWILCVDNQTFDSIEKLSLSNVRLMQLELLETEKLRELKNKRTKGEYCWTLTPFTMKFVFDADESINRVTYLDADLWFRKNPTPIFKEFESSGKSVLITDHAFAPELDQSTLFGQYCVQFMIIVKGQSGENIRKWWESRCIEWCYNRTGNGKFGDQKYLDDWPNMFSESVHVLQNKELMLAPWNATRFPYGNSILWHFHGLRISGNSPNNYIYYGGYPLPPETKKYIYQPYILELAQQISRLQSIGFTVKTQIKFKTNLFVQFKSILKAIYSQLWKFNIYSHEPVSKYNDKISKTNETILDGKGVIKKKQDCI
jgi:hypothetical protein